MNYDMKRPCDQCPFRSDIRPYLTGSRVREIWNGFERGEFPCHKTVKHDDDENRIDSDQESHCAGALILAEKSKRTSQMMRICERLGFYDYRQLDMDAPVFDSIDDMIDAQPASNRKRSQ